MLKYVTFCNVILISNPKFNNEKINRKIKIRKKE